MNQGGVAQLGEHLLCKQRVVSSILSTSTKKTYQIEVWKKFSGDWKFQTGIQSGSRGKSGEIIDN